MISYEPIGTIHTPFTEPEGMPIQPVGAEGVEGTVEVFEEYREGLSDLEAFSHVVLIYHLHMSAGYDLKVIPFLDTEPRGLFATRAPRRPNPIGLSVVRLDGIEDGLMRVRNLDILDGTPLLDIKPFVPAFDDHEEYRSGWLERAAKRAGRHRSDSRFRGEDM